MTTTTLSASTTTTGVNIASGDDGTLTIKTGATAGAQVNALSFAADGTPTFLKVPANSAVQSMVRVNTANGYGSTNTAIRKFTNVTNGVNGCVIQGADITLANDASLGASFTINTSGVYVISYSDAFNASAYFGVSLNSSQLSTTIASIAIADRILYSNTSVSNASASVSAGVYLPSGSVVRPHAASPNASDLALTLFTITRVA